jgi:hypothetical protein
MNKEQVRQNTEQDTSLLPEEWAENFFYRNLKGAIHTKEVSHKEEESIVYCPSCGQEIPSVPPQCDDDSERAFISLSGMRHKSCRGVYKQEDPDEFDEGE